MAGLLVVFVSLGGCRSEECARMVECCKAIEGTDGAGGICDARAEAVDDPKTCKTVLETVGYMFEERDEQPPEVCRLSPEG